MSYYKIRPRSGTAAQWTSANPILAEREIGFEYPAGGLGTGRVKMKMGDGSTHWNDLPYATVSPIVENVESSSTENVPSSAYVKTKFDALNSNLTVVEEMLPFTYNNKGVNIYFRKWGNVLSVLFAKETESMNLPTVWTSIGTLTIIKAPSGSTRYIPFISSNGLTGTLRLYADGGVRIIAHSSNAYWMQSSATVVL